MSDLKNFVAISAARSRKRLRPRPRLCGLIVVLSVVFTTEVAAQAAGQLTPAQSRAVDSARVRVRAWMAEKNLPGVSVAVGVEGKLVWAEGFGWADLEQRVAVSDSTRFRVGSASKGLTSAAVGQLHERGKLRLDEPVRTYVSSFPEKRWPISTRQLMSHIAGIRHYRGDEPYSSKHYDNVLAALEIFAADSLLFQPGTKYSYSSYGWNLVSAVVENAARTPFLEYMRREVFAPIGMTHTAADDVFEVIPGRARFYVRDSGGQVRNERFVDQSNKWAGGGFLSTPSDLVKFGFAMLDGKLLKPETVNLLWTPAQLESGETTGYGLGWFTNSIGGRRAIASPGTAVGGNTAFVIFPEQRVVIAVMSNVTGAELPPIWQTLARLFTPTKASDD